MIFRDAANAAFRVRVTSQEPVGWRCREGRRPSLLESVVLLGSDNLRQQILTRCSVLVYRRERARSVVLIPDPVIR